MGEDARQGGDGPRVWAEIGTEEEVRAAAAAVVRGEVIQGARILDLRKLVEAVQGCEGVRLSAIGNDDDATCYNPTTVKLQDCRIVQSNLASLIVGVGLSAISCAFENRAIFKGTRFAGPADFVRCFFATVDFDSAMFVFAIQFDDTVFGRGMRFAGAKFMSDASFMNARFEGAARGEAAEFRGAAFFEDVHFSKGVFLKGAIFTNDAWFEGAIFADRVLLNEAVFSKDAHFSGARFEKQLWAFAAHFVGSALFTDTVFHHEAWFEGVRFEDRAIFSNGCFCDQAYFMGASFQGIAGFGGASFVREVRFDGASFAKAADGDLRGSTVRECVFRSPTSSGILPRMELATSPTAQTTDAGRKWRSIERWVRVEFGWRHVRALGHLSILSRVSLVALIAVPLLAAVWPAVQAFASAYHREIAETRLQVDRLLHEVERAAAEESLSADVEERVLGATANVERAADAWGARLTELLAEDPALGTTLALTFFAAVAVTLGLLVYQIACPPEVKSHDEDDFVQRTHARYSDAGEVQRRDGLGRSIEQLEEIARRRSDRHPSFVKHGRVTVWVPPREKVEWFDDKTLPSSQKLAEAVAAARRGPTSAAGERISGAPNRSDAVAMDQRDGFVPGAERARIVIEEGAKAEYWLLGRRNLKWTALSFGLYVVGIGFLLAILVMQCVQVGIAAGMW